ncbi:MAG: coproporphyrinogen-III oxidase family protein [Candidatus Limnocylindrus sp.]
MIRPQPPRGLYLHVPFCRSLCPYCDFVVIAGAAAFGPRSRMGGYLRAVEREIDLRATASDKAYGALGSALRTGDGTRVPLESLYLGGGTPSLLPEEALAGLIARVRDRFGLADGAEVTLECNPGADERGDARAAVQAGVTRFSIGVQSMNTAALRDLGRRHSPEDAAASVTAARVAGAKSVSIDLLADLPNVSLESWAASLSDAIAINPDHISVYALTLATDGADAGGADDRLATPAGALAWRARAAAAQDEERGAEELELLDTRLPAAGFNWYEISNWAREGHASHHNRLYWERAAVEAVGPGAHAFDGARRRWNSANLDAWEAALHAGELPPGGVDEPLREESAAAEVLVLSLRMSDGVNREEAMRGGFGDALRWGESNGLLAVHPDDSRRIQLTLRGRLLSNELFSRIV